MVGVMVMGAVKGIVLIKIIYDKQIIWQWSVGDFQMVIRGDWSK
jgi:hypothetical protein